MKAAVFYEYRKPFKIEDIPIPEIKGEQVLIKTAGCGLCHTDLHIWLGELKGLPEKIPAVLGHEPSGFVAAKGDLVPENIKLGMPVIVQGGYYVEDDIYTLKGANQLAMKKAQQWTGVLGLYGGGYSEYFIVPSYRYLVNAEGIDDIVAASALSDAGLTPYRAVKRTFQMPSFLDFAEPDDFVVVVGVGGLGSYGAQYVNVLKPSLNLIVADVKEEALNLVGKVAKVHTFINPSKEDPVEAIRKTARNKKVMAVIDFVGVDNTIRTYSQVLASGGIYTVVGLGGTQASFSIPDTVLNEIIFMGNLWGSIADLREVVTLARRRAIDYKTLITKKWKLEEINEAFDVMHRGKYVGRMVITFAQ